MKRIIKGKVNLGKATFTPLANVKQLDDIILELDIYSNSVPLNITQQNISLYAKRSNKTTVEQIDNITKNTTRVTIDVKNSCFANPGITEMELKLIDNTGSISTSTFYITVEESLSSNESINANNEISILDEAKIEEPIRQENEYIRVSNENARKTNEMVRNEAEELRKQNEVARESNESIRKTNEEARKVSENQRATDEGIRQTNEYSRKSEETVRINNENTRQTNEDIRVSNEILRENNENVRKTNESSRESSENLRKTSETFRETNELSRINNENTRQTNEDIRISNEDARKLAETLREQAFADSQTQHDVEFNKSQTDKTNAFNLSEANRANIFIDSEKDRNTSFAASEQTRQNTFNTNEQDRISNDSIIRKQWNDLITAAADSGIGNSIVSEIIVSRTDLNGTEHPTIGARFDYIESHAEQNVQSDWNITDANNGAFIKNKPNLSTVATTGSYTDLSNKPSLLTINDAETTATSQTWSAKKINDSLITKSPTGHTHTPSDVVGLGSAATLMAGTSANNVLMLDSTGKIPTNVLPSIIITNAEVQGLLEGKVDKVTGKGLSTNDYTTEEKQEVAKIPNIQSELDDYSSYASLKDGDLYTVIDFKRKDSTLYLRSTLSSKDTNGNFQVCTLNYYDDLGINIIKTIIWNFTYDNEGKIITKEVL